MALRKRLNQNRERNLPENEGGLRNGSEHNEKPQHTENGIDRNSRSDSPVIDDNESNSNAHNKDELTNQDNSNDKDGKSESTGKSIASRFGRMKKRDNEKKTEEDPKSIKNRFHKNKDAGEEKDTGNTRQHVTGSKTPHDVVQNEELDDNDERRTKDQQNQLEKDLELGPLRILEPIRTDPVLQLKTRRKKLDRLTAEHVPEIHIIGNILSGAGIIRDMSEGATCRWKVDGGSGWEHLGGELFGQTQVSYAACNIKEAIPFNHPLDIHFAEPGISTWGSPRLMLQCYRLDVHGRRILAGYGFIHLPTTPGMHKLEANLWRPIGTSSEEMDSSYLGRMPALITHEPIYDSAWDERCRLVTVPTGNVYLDLFVVTRFRNKH